MMLAIAIFMAMLKLNMFVTIFINALNGFINIEKKITVPILKNKLKCASFFDSLLAVVIPQKESKVVPILAPKIKGIACGREIKPDNASTCSIAIKTLDD